MSHEEDQIVLNFCVNILTDYYNAEGQIDLHERLSQEVERIFSKRKMGDSGDSNDWTKNVDFP